MEERDLMSSEDSPGLRQVLLVLAAMFAFSLMAFFTRGAQAHILGVAAWRAVFVAVIFGISVLAVEGGVPALRPDKTTLRLGSWLGVALAVASSTFVGGYALTTVANTIFLHNLAPVVVFPLAWLLYKERPQSGALTGAGIALFGVALLTGVSLFQVSHYANARFLFGDLLALISAVGYAAVIVIIAMTRRAETPILGTLFVAWTVAAIILVVVALGFGALAIPGSAVLWILGLAIICTNVPFYLLSLGMRSVGAGMAAVLSLSEVIFATVLGIVVYGEHLAPIGWIGGVLAGLGVLYAMTQREGDGAVSAPSALDGQTRSRRLLRVGLGLVLLNGGVLLGLESQSSAGLLMALAGLVILARLGPAVAHSWLDGRFGRLTGWIGATVAAVAAAGCFVRGGTLVESWSIWAIILPIGVVLIDTRLAKAETEREDQPLLYLALLLLAGGNVLGWMQHSMAGPATEAANFALGWAGAGLAVAGISGALVRARPSAEGALARMEAPARWLHQGRRPAALAGLIWLVGALHVVPTGHVGIVERFGAPISQTAGAGLVIRAPAPIEGLTLVDVSRVRRLVLSERSRALLTGDQSMVSLDGVLHYTVSDPERFAYGSADPEQILGALVRAALVAVVVGGTQDAVLTTGRSVVEQSVMQITQARADAVGLGVRLQAVHLTQAAVPPAVLAAFLDVISADEERLTRINQGEAYAAEVVPKARGQALASLSAAQGDAAEIKAAADVSSAVFLAISDGGAAAPSLTRARMTWESLEERLTPARLVLAPSGVRVWWGDGDGSAPVDIESTDTTGSRR
jgi:membrane protease subunit HflK